MSISFDDMLNQFDDEVAYATAESELEEDRRQQQASEPLATEKQVSYLEALRDGKDTSTLAPNQRAWLADVDFKTIPKRRASDVIETLKELPWAPKDDEPMANRTAMPEVPNGRYAVHKELTSKELAGLEAHSPGADGTGRLMFYSVKKGTHTTFVDVWASDARFPIKAREEKIRILTEIAKDPITAMRRFGEEIGKCGRCGRTLTDENSRAFGIGPECRQILGI